MQRVREALQSVPEVEAVDINFQEKTAKVTMKEGKTTDRTAIEAALKEKGYGVTGFEQVAGVKH